MLAMNQITKFDAQTMPNMEELLDKIGKLISLPFYPHAKGYWQITLSPNDREKTAFASPKGLNQFVTFPFGLSGATVHFNK